MSRIEDLSPDPKSHIRTLMRIGYTLPSAVADIIDNSITAQSNSIEIYAPPGLDNPLISILDNGIGMSSKELIVNMKIGCKDPNEERGPNDLGRFGSGMKTASFSQARRLTVISKKKGESITAAVWDIDRIEHSNSWQLEVLEESEIKLIPGVSLNSESPQGTQIIWEKLTCLHKGSHVISQDEDLADQLTELGNYIGLYFHRFLERKNKLSIFINKKRVEGIDPYMRNTNGYQEGPSEKLRCKEGYISIQTHVLPHFNQMNPKDLEKMGGAEGVAQNQGVYIYRSERLIIAGSWLGLAKNSQLGALARVQVDVPTSIDHEWSTDVKKSSLQLPGRIKKELKRFLSDPIKRSKRTHTYRGDVETANNFWKIIEDKNKNTITYQVDTSNNELVKLLSYFDKESIKTMLGYLKQLSSNLPIHHIYEKMSEKPKSINQKDIDLELMNSILSGTLEEFLKSRETS